MASAFERVVDFKFGDEFSPEVIRKKHIEFARRELSRFLSRQQEKPSYRIEVDGHAAASEDGVRPFGTISYVFLRLPMVAKFAINTARDLSPVKSGRYKKSWFIIYNNQEIDEHSIPPTASEVLLSNDVEYSRKIHVRGARLANVPPGIVERVRQAVVRRFGGIVSANIEFITLQRGYKLKHPIKRGRRIERELTYPSLLIRSKF